MKDKVKDTMKGKIGSSPSCLYVLGFIGSSVHFIGSATGFWVGVIGFLKAIVWPAFMVYEVFMFVNH